MLSRVDRTEDGWLCYAYNFEGQEWLVGGSDSLAQAKLTLDIFHTSSAAIDLPKIYNEEPM